MREYCGCQSLDAIAELTAEHDRLRELGASWGAAHAEDASIPRRSARRCEPCSAPTRGRGGRAVPGDARGLPRPDRAPPGEHLSSIRCCRTGLEPRPGLAGRCPGSTSSSTASSRSRTALPGAPGDPRPGRLGRGGRRQAAAGSAVRHLETAGSRPAESEAAPIMRRSPASESTYEGVTGVTPVRPARSLDDPLTEALLRAGRHLRERHGLG